MISGVVVALQYDFATPFFSTNAMDALVPFGEFWRSLHFYSSQLFFLLCLGHFMAIFIDKSYLKLSFAKWIPLVASLPVALLLLFGGYVLRGDATGENAGIIAENICLSVPLIGSALNTLLFSVLEDGLKRVYANHIVGLGVVWGILCWDHVRKYRAHLKDHALFISFTLLLSLVLQAPMEPESLGVFHRPGPWFFLGLQELLRYVQPFWAGIIFPLSLVISLTSLYFKDTLQKQALFYSCCWLLVYCSLTFVALGR
ncbi:MAG: cytochrome b N-terminal domain-containing protein [Proteobacteria bacterium]|nr:cytochrome b N-terminal domain-containing protein [Pseudomonadota bacterium]MBU1640516.1 cytochrome b N-terminal domain-containing protein [Pseudomonadota bacterium]